ncbi:MAG: PD40 domain-containing protein [Acidobacteria bacterium]|nr:PD40 domain-containing protein [Acidobacteriota bacterium]
MLSLEGDRKPVPFLETEFNEFFGRFSPDGKWIAYASNESGPYEVYVRGFPKSGGQWMVSNGGGSRPRWRRDGKELFYLTADRKLMAVEVKAAGATFEYGQPRELFQTSAANLGNTDVYDVTADGKRFLVNTALEEAAATPITVVENWAAGAKR